MAETERGREIINQLSKLRTPEPLRELTGEDSDLGTSLNNRLPIIRTKVDQGNPVLQKITGLFGVGKSYVTERIRELYELEFPDIRVGTINYEEGRDEAEAEKKANRIKGQKRSLSNVDLYNYHYERLLNQRLDEYDILIDDTAVKTGVILGDQLVGINGGSWSFYRLVRREPPHDSVSENLTIYVDDIIGNFYTHWLAISYRHTLERWSSDQLGDLVHANKVQMIYGKPRISEVSEMRRLRRAGAPPYLQATAYEKYKKEVVVRIIEGNPEYYSSLENHSENLMFFEELVPSLYIRRYVAEHSNYLPEENFKIWHNNPQPSDLPYFNLDINPEPFKIS